MGGQTFGQLLVCLFAVQTCYAYQFYQLRIPNGETVPHPCKANNLWRGVGHLNLLGGGARNPFGIDFKNNGAKWNATICNKDSDNDGLTNGEELGDPRCEWTSGQAPQRTTGLSHPGICEPLGSERCGPKPDWVSCEKEDFKCDVLNEPETFNFTVRIPSTPVPAVETTYTCMLFELPIVHEYHLVAQTPYIDNEAVMHHIIVNGCTSSELPEGATLNEPYPCGMGGGEECEDTIGTWAVGIAGSCEHPHTGFLVGGANGYRYASFQFHWNNPERRDDYMDSSGINFFLTPRLRKYNAGVLLIGQQFLEIPPLELQTITSGGCSGSCTNRYMTDNINITTVFNHMHYLGISQYTELRRDGRKITSLADDETYSYDSPVIRNYVEPIVARPGDEFKTTCVFKSTSRTKTTYYGDETSDEMCFVFLTYYPKENMKGTFCTNLGSIDTCDFETGVVQGCNFALLSLESNSSGVALAVAEKCSPTHCRKECKEYVKELKATDPCYQGDFYELIRKRNFFREGARQSREEFEFYSSLDSCDTELALERYMVNIGGGETGAANAMAASLITCLIGLVMQWSL